eukprot:420931-Amphidinium_carterae.1
MAAAEEEEGSDGCDMVDPFDLLAGMGNEELYKVTAVAESDATSTAVEPSPVEELPAGLSAFLFSCEVFLLSITPGLQVPEIPTSLTPEVEAECSSLLGILEHARVGQVGEVLSAHLLDDYRELLGRSAAERIA